MGRRADASPGPPVGGAPRYPPPVSLDLLVGPPGAGKTHLLTADARAAAEAGERVWWVGRGDQRAHVLRTLVRDGPMLGVEVLTWQQLAYRVLSDARRLQPLLTGSGRLATVGAALLEDRSDPPTPGEARLFARAIAEAKAYGVAAGRLPGDDAEVARLRRVHHRYETLKGDAWDYDDFRREAAVVLEGDLAPATAALLPDRVLLDGVDEVAPAELRLADALARHVPVRLTVAVPPPGRTPATVLPARDDVDVRRHAFANPVAEARWVLRDVKATLAAGADPLDLAIVAPPGRARAVATLAREAGVGLMDETPRGLADTPEGRRLLDLLELGDAPTPGRLLGVPDLRALGAAALAAGVAGRDALLRLAEDRGEGERWRAWSDALEPAPDADLLAWGAGLVDAAWAAVHAPADAPPGEGGGEAGGEAGNEGGGEAGGEAGNDVGGDPGEGAAGAGDDPEARTAFREHALQRLAEARRVAGAGDGGAHVRAWWAALLQEDAPRERPPAGVALLHADQIAGRRFARVWILGATDGAHLPPEREDYFVAEDARVAWPDAFAGPALPVRFRAGRDAAGAALRARGDVVTITVAAGDGGGPTTPDAALLGGAPTPPPERPAASALELGEGRRWRPPDAPVDLGPPDVPRLVTYATCGVRAWGERHLPRDDAPPAWAALRRALLERDAWTPPDLRSLAEDHPAFATWLDAYAEPLADLTFAVRLRDPESGVPARLDAARREAGEATLVRFLAPGRAADDDAAEAAFDAHPELGWAGAQLLARRDVQAVRFRLWPVGDAPVDWPERGPIRKAWGRMERTVREVREALPPWHAGGVTASPGFACRDCPVFDLCREGVR